ncbi:MAG TPA: hypothetical protein V6D18_13710 [Thermosynechococcaceae cyanobacterium]
MLTHPKKLVSLLFTSTDLPIWSGLETTATLYQKDQEQFHLLMTEPVVRDRDIPFSKATLTTSTVITPRLLWLEFSPYRAVLTMQGNGSFTYRHLWERGLYGLSQFSLQCEVDRSRPLCLRNFTRNLDLKFGSRAIELRVEYELWSEQTQLGRYVLAVEIRND